MSASSTPAVQLAYPGEYLSDGAWRSSERHGHGQRYTDADDAFTDKAGGACMWHAELPPPSAEATQCRVCNGPLFLLAQLYLPGSAATGAGVGRLPAHLYVLACNKVACALSGQDGCWRALKLTVNDAEEGPAPHPALLAGGATTHAALPAEAAPAPAAAQASAAAAAAASPAKAAKPATSSSSSAAPKPAAAPAAPVAAAAKAESDDDEWGAKAAWSDDEDSASAKQKKKGTGKSKAADDDDDDDAILTALLAKQSLQQEANRAAKAAAAEKADKAAAARAAKAARKEEMRAQATQELMEAALEARRKAEADGTTAAAASASSSSSSGATAAPVSASAGTGASASRPPTCFRPFYLAWCAEPAPSAPEHSREMRLLREYEARMAEEGEEGELAALRGAQNGGDFSAVSMSTDEEDEEDAVERRDDDTQAFFDRVDRLRDQCVRYYEPAPSGASTAVAAAQVAAQAVYSSKSELAFRDGVARNPTLRCPRCRATRQLQVQLMPKLLWEMHVDSVDPSDPGMDWLTLDVYTCPMGCCTNEYMEEHVHAQPPL